jgi:hypothetical protein
MKEREFWREPAGGHVYAVELEDGLVTGSCGPLDTGELDERYLPSFDYSPDQAAWLEVHRAEFDHQPSRRMRCLRRPPPTSALRCGSCRRR